MGNNTWSSLFESVKIPKQYQSDIIKMCKRIINIENQKDDDKIDYIVITIQVLSKIDLSKVEFTNNIDLCEKFNLSIALDRSNFGIRDIKSQYMSNIVNELVKTINDKIEKNGGVIIYDIVNCFYQVDDPTDYYRRLHIRMVLIDIKSARYAKILKIQERIKWKSLI